jgi:hypothetical protein
VRFADEVDHWEVDSYISVANEPYPHHYDDDYHDQPSGRAVIARRLNQSKHNRPASGRAVFLLR